MSNDLFSDTKAAASTCTIIMPELSPVCGVRNPGRPLRSGLTRFSVRRSLMLRQIGDGRGEQVGSQGDRLGVEVAARQHLAGVGEHERVVGRRIHLPFDDAGDERQGVAEGAVDLRHAADAVGVLHLPAIGVRRDDLAAFEQPADVGGTGDLPGMRANL